MTEPVKMIAFIIPNASSKKRIFSFAVPVDSVEEVTGYDFFTTLNDELEEKLEKECNIIQWLN
jgi:endonuclease G